ncbi:hypothetical protein OAF45_02405 [Candidatus Latescibacteria bacterium]|nr:hypothetical protein [Candidatus Latescibacterota bacterium]
MTIEQRLEQVEQQNQKIQRTNKRLTVALTMMAVVVCAVVTMAATGLKDGDFDVVTARHIAVVNDAGNLVVGLGANDGGGGMVRTWSAKGKDLVQLSATVNDHGTVTTYQPNGKESVTLSSTADGNGTVTTYQPNGKELVNLTTTVGGNGGFVQVYNKTGESIAQMYADEYGNGVVYAGNRKGIGRTLQPGP